MANATYRSISLIHTVHIGKGTYYITMHKTEEKFGHSATVTHNGQVVFETPEFATDVCANSCATRWLWFNG
jgi:hypothetical protein